ncbi:MAG: DNA mismatch repair protein MutS [Ruminococcaceae bacterium]|nr:DNA mismatch repair protein MutS [Oscillospiraceae bacterium]
MMEQYLITKEQYGDCILFYRLGDFYEMFFEDAITASRELEITLTGKNCGLEERAPMCGVPFHSANVYIAKLVEKGYKVAICEQVEDPKLAKGLVKREVVRIITPGTVVDELMLNDEKNNYLCVLYQGEGGSAIAVADVSTGEVYAAGIEDESRVMGEIVRYAPVEILMNAQAQKSFEKQINTRLRVTADCKEEEYFSVDAQRIDRQFGGVQTENQMILCAVSAMLRYLEHTQKSGIEYMNRLQIYSVSEYMELDAATRRNLEITETMRDKAKKGSLLWVLDRTRTSMGARKLAQWLEKPLIDTAEIKKRHQAVDELYRDLMLRDELRDILNGIYDIARIVSRISLRTVSPRDMIALKLSLLRLPELEYQLSKTKSPMLSALGKNMDIMEDVRVLLEESICDEPPATLRDGEVIKGGYNTDLDELRFIKKEGTGWIAEAEAKEREETGIKNLKIRYNKVFGYYIEVSNSYKEMIPEHYMRKQTLVNCERYITPKLKEMESTILGAAERIVSLEAELYEQIRSSLEMELDRLKAVCDRIATIDVLASFAEVAYKQNYVMPEMVPGGVLYIQDGRHPVVEKMQKDTLFVPNDTDMDPDDARMMILTGPNMAGKSTYMRQVALITLMAQVGSFVPASAARMTPVDKIFTRVGASDDIAAGQSTFMLEMVEVAAILAHATKHSLVILDEIGRGTSTFDGLSIAWAVAEHMQNPKKSGAKTLFATHYHELTELEDRLDGVKNYRIAVKKRGDDITFLRKIVRGGADDSYGIEVAALAGVPKSVIARAKEILEMISNDEISAAAPKKQETPAELPSQMDFEAQMALQIAEELKRIDVTTYTPIEALNVLFELSKRAKGE